MNGSTGAALASIPLDRIAQAMGERASHYTATHFAAFRIVESAGGFGHSPSHRTYAIDLDGEQPADIGAARDAALLEGAFDHKEHLLVRETGPKGVKLHLFAIKRQSAPVFVWRDHRQVREHRLYAAPVCVIDGGVIA